MESRSIRCQLPWSSRRRTEAGRKEHPTQTPFNHDCMLPLLVPPPPPPFPNSTLRRTWSSCGGAMWRRGCSLILVIKLLLHMALGGMAERPYNWFCFGRSNYPANGTFAHNRQRALASVVANMSLTGFHIALEGKTPDLAFAVAQCRGDLDGEACQVCLSDAASQVERQCPQNGLAIILFQACILACSDTRPTLPPAFISMSIPGLRPIPNPKRFKPLLTFFLKKLIFSATTNSAGRLFWGDKFKYTHNLTIYGIAQCLQYVTPNECRSCLDKTFARMLRDAAGAMSGVVYHDFECLLRFAPFPIFAPPPHKVAPSSIVPSSSNCSQPTLSNKAGSPFHGNLMALFSSLILHTPASGFYTDTIGIGSIQVHGQALCRGDVPDDVCWECIAEASTRIRESCPNSRRAIIWLERCQLRYADENFAGMIDVYDNVCQPSVEKASNPASFSMNLKFLMANLTLVAMKQGSSNGFFARGVSLFPESKRIYALVQCVRDIPAVQCGWCLQNASSDIARCFNGKQSGRILRGSCSIAFGVKPFFSGDPIPVLLPQPNHGHKRWWIFVVVGFIAGILLTAACAFCLLRRRKKHLEKAKQKEATSVHHETVKENAGNYDLPHMSLKTMEDATDKFSESNKLGEGGYGPVYKGKLPSGQEVAVKRLSGRSYQGLKEFRNEVESMAKLQHTNLARLIGCCLEKGEKMLIYEYMPNKSLDFFLKEQESRLLLDWEKRFNIIMGIARGMRYLHQDSRHNVIHRDLKASNVLLDEQLNPKISDFGLARIFNGVQGLAATSVIIGTRGYMAPEYAMDGVFSTKSDVYSFGILVLEIISGQLNSASICVNYDGSGLLEHGWSLWCEGKKADFIDPILTKATSASDQMLRCLHIGFLCIQEDFAIRPTMSEVVSMLGSNSLDLPLPTRPAFIGESVARSSLRRSSVVNNIDSSISTNIGSGSTTT